MNAMKHTKYVLITILLACFVLPAGAQQPERSFPNPQTVSQELQQLIAAKPLPYLFLSNTVRMHLKLREAGVPADLMVFEGMSHAHYHMVAEALKIAPETRFHFSELGRFFSRYLQ